MKTVFLSLGFQLPRPCYIRNENFYFDNIYIYIYSDDTLETGMFRDNLVNTMALDAAAPCTARSSAIILSIHDE